MTDFNQTVLTAIRNLGGNAYGVSIHEAVGQASGRSVSYGELYVALGELEEQGRITSREEPGGLERGGRPKRYYRVRG